MKQYIICPTCGTTAATLETEPGTAVSASPPLPAPVASFVNERCRLQEGATVQSADLYAAYEAWSATSGLSTVTPKAFGMKLTDLPGVGRHRTKEARLYTGITLAD